MIWIAIAIIIVGILIYAALNDHNKKIEEIKQRELELKQQELESKPEYRKKKALEEEYEKSKVYFEQTVEKVKESKERLKSAKESGNKPEIKRWEEIIEQEEKQLKELKKEGLAYMEELKGIKIK